jgi:hypothetical protein
VTGTTVSSSPSPKKSPGSVVYKEPQRSPARGSAPPPRRTGSIEFALVDLQDVEPLGLLRVLVDGAMKPSKIASSS